MSSFSLENHSGDQTQIPPKPPDLITSQTQPTLFYKHKLLKDEFFATNTNSIERIPPIPMDIQPPEPEETTLGEL